MSGENNYLNYDKLYNKVSQVITDEYLNNNNEYLFSRCPPAKENKDLINFKKLLKDVRISNKEKIEQNILQALQKAHELSTTTMKERMNNLTGGLNLNLPGFDNSES